VGNAAPQRRVTDDVLIRRVLREIARGLTQRFKRARELDAGDPQVRFDEWGVETEPWSGQ
jgi:hypothetical protein